MSTEISTTNRHRPPTAQEIIARQSADAERERANRQGASTKTEIVPAPIHVIDDGWNDAATEANERVLKGALLRFADRQWTTGTTGTPVEDGTRLVALATVAMWVRWEDGKPAEYRTREPGRRMPDREELGRDDENAWERGADGRPMDPWRNTRLVYLVGPDDAAAYTFSTASWGGRTAVSDLGDQIARMRTHHPHAVPMVELRWAPMPTKYGMKSKPMFRVVGWKSAAGLLAVEPAEQQQIEPPTMQEEVGDEIPF